MKQKLLGGFTIVELLVIIVVISILAGIVYASYNNVINNAAENMLKEDLRGAHDQLERQRSQGVPYPSSAAQANDGKGLKHDVDTNFDYQKSGDSFCLSATSVKRQNVGPFYITSSDRTPQNGSC